MATLRNKRKLLAVTRKTQGKHPRNGQSRNTSVPRINEEDITNHFLKRLIAESLKNCPRSSTGLSPAFWVLCLSWWNFSWTHRYRRAPEAFREHSGTQTWKTRNQIRIVPRMILIPKWDPPPVSLVIQLIQTQTGLLTIATWN